MSYDPRRAALLCLCVLTVLLAASLFPASGFGSFPTGDIGSDGAGFSFGPPPLDGVFDGAAPAPAPDPTPEPTPEPEPEPAPDTSGNTGSADANLAALLVAFVFAVPVLGVLSLPVLSALGYRRGEGFTLAHESLPDLPPPRVRAALQAVPRTTMAVVMAVSAALPGLFDGVVRAAGGTASALASVLGGSARTLGGVAVGVTRVAGRGVATVGAGLAGAALAFPAALGTLGGGLTGRSWPFGRDRPTARPDTDVVACSPPEPAETGPLSVEEAWAAMTGLLGREDSATPGQYARAAIDRGLPADAVRRLTRAFQEVRYGGRADEDHTAAAREAIDRIRGALDGGEDA